MMLSNGKVAKMSDKLPDTEIVKAFKVCNDLEDGFCKDCPHEGVERCIRYTNQKVLDLINRQKAEIERLQAYHDEMEEAIYSFREDHAKVKFFKKEIQAKAVKEFWGKLKVQGKEKVDYDTPEGCDSYFANGTLCGYVAMKEVGDNLLKEMVGDESA